MSLDHLQLLRTDVRALADTIANGPPDAAIAGCPGWTLHDLGAHLGGVQRWAREAARTAAPPQIDPNADPAPPDAAALAQWLRDGAERLIATLGALAPDAPTWHPFQVEPKVAGLWPRRQAQEAFVHRIDGDIAVGRVPQIDPARAADGVDEYWSYMLPRMLTREQRTPPASVVATELTDTGGRWVADGRSGSVVRGDDTPAAVLRGTAADMLLRLWGRPVPELAISVEGDAAVAAAWLALGGS